MSFLIHEELRLCLILEIGTVINWWYALLLFFFILGYMAHTMVACFWASRILPFSDKSVERTEIMVAKIKFYYKNFSQKI